MKTTPTLEQVIDAIQEPVIRGLLTTWRINREITTEKLSVMTYRQLKSQLGPKSIRRLYLECWNAVSPDMTWMEDHEKDYEKKQEKRLSPIEVVGYPITHAEVRWAEIEASAEKMQVLATPSIRLFLRKFREKGEAQQSYSACERANQTFPIKLPRNQRLHLLFLINQRLQFDGVLFRFRFLDQQLRGVNINFIQIIGRAR